MNNTSIEDTFICVAVFKDHQFSLWTSFGSIAGSYQFLDGFRSWMCIIEESKVDVSLQKDDLHSSNETSVSLADSQSKVASKTVSITGSMKTWDSSSR